MSRPSQLRLATVCCNFAADRRARPKEARDISRRDGSDDHKTKKQTRAADGKQNGSLTTVAYNVIKSEILGNQLKAGEALPIERLIRELGLSRTPLREAILQLEKEGFVQVRPRMGASVSHLNLREIQEMYQVRRELEGLAARLVAWAGTR